MNEFALTLNEEMMGTRDNLFWSPYSVFSALAMVAAGSADGTRQEFFDVLKFGNKKEWEEVSETNQIIKSVRSKNLLIEYANSIWAQKDQKWKEEFLAICKEHFQSEVKFVDFLKDSEKSRQEINHWVEEKTKEKINNILPQGSVGQNTRMILCNCVYFKGSWENPFEKELTYDQTFWGRERPVSVPTMHRNEKMIAFADEENAVVRLPYIKGNAYMNIFVPHQKDANGIDRLEKKLDKSYMDKMIDNACSIDVRLTLPKFKIECANELKGPLQNCGINKAFANDAEFSMYEEPGGIKIDQVFHKAFVEVNEEGTEAAASTTVTMVFCCTAFQQEVREIVIEADHPFIFTITATNGNILFMGRINQL